MAWTYHLGDLDTPDVQALLALHFASMRSSSPVDACHVLAAEELRDPAIRFWSVRDGDRLLGVGALQALSKEHGEVKSMRTAQEALGRGVGRAMLLHIIADARRAGFKRLSLETGSTPPFAAAIRLYESEGFARCDPFGDYAGTQFNIFMTRTL